MSSLSNIKSYLYNLFFKNQKKKELKPKIRIKEDITLNYTIDNKLPILDQLKYYRDIFTYKNICVNEDMMYQSLYHDRSFKLNNCEYVVDVDISIIAPYKYINDSTYTCMFDLFHLNTFNESYYLTIEISYELYNILREYFIDMSDIPHILEIFKLLSTSDEEFKLILMSRI